MSSKNFDDMKDIIRMNAIKIQSKWRKIVTGNEKKRIRDLLKEAEEKPKMVKLFDKLGFTFGVLNILVCQYFLLNVPEYFSIWYGFIIPIILMSRFYHFNSLNWQYFLIDFCYIVNICTLINLLFISYSFTFFKVCFIHATGTLPLAIVIWRNSLVFHDYDKIVSIYIHILPTMLYHSLRWYHPRISEMMLEHAAQGDDYLTLKDYFFAILLYLCWQAFYLYKTEYYDREKFSKNPDLLTSLRWMSKDTKNPFARAALVLLRKLRIFDKTEEYDSTSLKTKAVFVASQFLITLVSLLPSLFLFNSGGTHLMYIGVIFTMAIFNGASFYIEVFSVRYHVQLEKLEKLQKIALEANNVVKQIAEMTPKRSRANTNYSDPMNPSPHKASKAEELLPAPRTLASVSEESSKSLEDISAVMQATSHEAIKGMIEARDDLLIHGLYPADPTAKPFESENFEPTIITNMDEMEASVDDFLLSIDEFDQPPSRASMTSTEASSGKSVPETEPQLPQVEQPKAKEE